jgi:hypothetical protein
MFDNGCNIANSIDADQRTSKIIGHINPRLAEASLAVGELDEYFDL